METAGTREGGSPPVFVSLWRRRPYQVRDGLVTAVGEVGYDTYDPIALFEKARAEGSSERAYVDLRKMLRAIDQGGDSKEMIADWCSQHGLLGLNPRTPVGPTGEPVPFPPPGKLVNVDLDGVLGKERLLHVHVRSEDVPILFRTIEEPVSDFLSAARRLTAIADAIFTLKKGTRAEAQSEVVSAGLADLKAIMHEGMRMDFSCVGRELLESWSFLSLFAALAWMIYVDAKDRGMTWLRCGNEACGTIFPATDSYKQRRHCTEECREAAKYAARKEKRRQQSRDLKRKKTHEKKARTA